jgi:hypothetical protein
VCTGVHVTTPFDVRTPSAPASPARSESDYGVMVGAARGLCQFVDPKDRKPQRTGILHHVPAALLPRAPTSAMFRVHNGKCNKTPDEARAHDAFFDRVSAMISLKHADLMTSLHLLDITQMYCCTPAAIVCDSAADLSIMISPRIANFVKISWTPSSARLFGIGGAALGHSYAHEGQRIVLRLGGFRSDRSVGQSSLMRRSLRTLVAR